MTNIRFLVCVCMWASPLLAFAQAQKEPVKNSKPEVLLMPGGLSPDALAAVQKGVSAVVRQADEQDQNEAARIRRRGHEAVVSALATKGYFNPNVRLEVGEDIGGDTWDISIDPGDISKVRSVQTSFMGSITQPTFSSRIEALQTLWKLPVGEDFVNANWSGAKSNLLENTREKDFFLAKIVHSQALVDPINSTVDTEVVIDSGPTVTLGHVEVIGLRRVPISLINRYLNNEPGIRYSQEQVETWRERLQATNYFRGVFITLKQPENQAIYRQDTVELPVTVRVTEAPAKSLMASLSFDDMVGFHGEATYKHNVVWGLPITLEAGVGADKKSQRAYLDVHLPPNASGSVDSFGVIARHSAIQNEKVVHYGLGWRRTKTFKWDPNSRVEFESKWGLMWMRQHIRRKNDPLYSTLKFSSLVATYDILRRDVDDKYDPRRGNLIAIGLGAGHNLKQKRSFSKASFRGQLWFPVGKRDIVTVRAEVGKVWAKKDTFLPSDFGFRTGGARTIRGYKYYGIGQRVGDAIIGTRALAVASAEYMHYFDDTFGMGVFVDVGDAAPSFKQMKMHVGYGVGALVKTPLGVINVDLAYGQQDKKLRLHFSLGIAF